MFTAAPRCIMVEQQGAQGRYRDGVEEMECDLPHETITVATRDSKIQAEVIEGSSQSGCAKSRKRGREIEEEEESSREVEKRGCEEGMSWWTCLMLGISQERTQPQAVKAVSTALLQPQGILQLIKQATLQKLEATKREKVLDLFRPEFWAVFMAESISKEDLSYLPEPPEKPLESDCCGTGCTPCVLDIYQEELEEWLKLKAMTGEERAQWRREERLRRQEGKDATDHVSPVAISPSEYRSFSVAKIKQLTADSFVFTFTLPAGHTLGLCIGQHITLRVCEAGGCSLSRQYTPISPLDHKGSFDVVIKIYEDGKMSDYIRHWKVGSIAEWRGPFGKLSYSQNKYERIGMLACGTGIAPMLQVIRAIVENDEEETFVHLVYGCRTQHDILLKEELDAYASFWNFTVLYALSRTSAESVSEDPGRIKYGDVVHYGRIDSELVKKEMPPPSERNLLLICGTKSFDKDMINHLTKAAGYNKNMYFKF